jgi:hypothetical protein
MNFLHSAVPYILILCEIFVICVICGYLFLQNEPNSSTRENKPMPLIDKALQDFMMTGTTKKRTQSNPIFWVKPI